MSTAYEAEEQMKFHDQLMRREEKVREIVRDAEELAIGLTCETILKAIKEPGGTFSNLHLRKLGELLDQRNAAFEAMREALRGFTTIGYYPDTLEAGRAALALADRVSK